ncbi:MAG: DUF2726 domain-containing protein [Methylophilaceae bacterium]
MTFFILLFLGLIVFFFVVIASKAGTPLPQLQEEIWPYYSKKSLTQPEQVMYHRLVEALPDKIILAQVQLSRFIGVNKGHDFNSWFNKINRMSIDFLVCEKDFSIIAAIELDDNSHNRPDRQDADDKKNKVLTAAKVRLIRWHVNSKPDINQIQREVLRTSTNKVHSKNPLLL